MIKLTAEIVETHYKDNMIVDRKACERMGINFEDEPMEGQPDLRPRIPYTPRIIYGDTVRKTEGEGVLDFFLLIVFGFLGFNHGRFWRCRASRCSTSSKGSSVVVHIQDEST